MEPHSKTPVMPGQQGPSPQETHKRARIFRTASWLILGTVVLFLVILVRRDSLHRADAIEKAGQHAAALSQRVGAGGLLPLNLAPEGEAPLPSGVEWPDRQAARLLRKHNGPVLAAWTEPLALMFAADGRAVILFENGRCGVEWLTLREFDRRVAEQKTIITRHAEMEEKNPPDLP